MTETGSKMAAADSIELEEAPLTRSWALVYTRARRRQIWAVITGVPVHITRAVLGVALEDSGQGRRYQAGLAGTLTLLPEGRWGATSAPGGDVIAWSELVPETKRLTVELPGRLHNSCARAARLEGLSLRDWVAKVLKEAAP